MVVWIDENRRIYAVNNMLTESEAEQYVNNVNCFWFDEPLPVVEAPENKGVSYYLTEDNTIEVVLFDIEPETPEPVPAEDVTWDIMAAAINEGVNEV